MKLVKKEMIYLMSCFCAFVDSLRQLMPAASVTEPPNPSSVCFLDDARTRSTTFFLIHAIQEIIFKSFIYIFSNSLLLRLNKTNALHLSSQ